ncbi:MAG: flagellar basal body-associated protein FliL [Verrucomicrobia bacterium]|nr:flagellar basal body-associated protein FliL [Verrucomicrobiota bacterium]
MKFTLLLCGILAVGIATAILAGTPQAGESGALNNAVILIIRHGEKPATGDQLTPAGEPRAQTYANFFKNFTLDGQPLKLNYLFASADSKASQRARLTIEPTSKLLGLAIDCQFADAKFQELADEIRAKPHGQNILICWHHGEIPQLVRALGADPGRLFPKGKWPDEVFNWLVELRYDSNGHLTKASRGSEQF